MEARSLVVVDGVEQPGEELGAVVLMVVGGVVALLAEDGHELRSGLEEPAAFADALEGAVESDGSGAGPVVE